MYLYSDHGYEYARYCEMAQKDIEEGMFHLKSYASDFEIIQPQNGSNSWSRALFQLQNSELAQNSISNSLQK